VSYSMSSKPPSVKNGPTNVATQSKMSIVLLGGAHATTTCSNHATTVIPCCATEYFRLGMRSRSKAHGAKDKAKLTLASTRMREPRRLTPSRTFRRSPQ